MNNRMKILLTAILVGVVVTGGLIGFLLGGRQNINNVKRSGSSSGSSQGDILGDQRDYQKDSFDGSVIYNGVRYEVNRNIDKILFLGVDSSNQERTGVGIDEGARSDTIILFIVDNEKKLITPLEINRDTMVDIDIYDNDGNYLTQGVKQLTMQYAYGDSPQKASNLTKEKVSDLLGRTRIDGVIALTMEGIEPIVDAIGGVTLTLSSDETDLDSSYVKGAKINLDGAAAKDFVHVRDVETRGSNIERMSRQTQFMIALFRNIKSKGESAVEIMENAAGDYLYEDIDADTMMSLTHYEYSGEVKLLPGENVIGKLHDEYYVDENKLIELVLELFYYKAE